jgi:hypothetical protein
VPWAGPKVWLIDSSDCKPKDNGAPTRRPGPSARLRLAASAASRPTRGANRLVTGRAAGRDPETEGRTLLQKGRPAAPTLQRRSVHRVTDDAQAAELEPSEELLAARTLETGLVEEDETYIYTPDDLLEADVTADYVWLQKGTGRKVYLVKKEQGSASQD